MTFGLLFLASSIIVSGHPVEVGRPVVLWKDPQGFNGYAESCVEHAKAAQSRCCERSFRRFSERKGLRGRTLDALRESVSQLVLHLDGCVNSRSCFYSMHDLPRPDGGCGLSAHFMIDADGTIYQTLDLLERAWHAEEVNSISIGVEICNRGDAGRNELDRLPPDYRVRPVKEVVINGHKIRAFDFRPEQYESVIALTRALLRIFPRIRPVIPEQNDKPLLETLRDPLGFAGIVGHLHVDLQRHKWDPGAFDWPRLKRALHGFYFPLPLRNWGIVPDDPANLLRALQAYWRNAEEHATGFFPVGPARLWHSGVHLRGGAGEPVYAPVRGRLVAALVDPDPRGARSFVLLRHEPVLDGAPVPFYTLLAHLAAQPVTPAARASWIRDLLRDGDPRALEALRSGHVALLDRSVEAGDIIGTVGVVQRGMEQGPEIHWEIFSPLRLTTVLGHLFRFVDGTEDGPFARRGAIDDLLAEQADPTLGAKDLMAFFRGGSFANRQAFRQLALRHPHEWGTRLGEEAYTSAEELSSWPEADRRRLHALAMAPYQFWTGALSQHTGLPSNQVVYFYHPVTFLGALAAHAQGFKLRAPAHAPIDDHAIERTHLPRGALAGWQVEEAPRTLPILGPVVDAEVAPTAKEDIPLIVLPPVSQ